MDAYVRARFFKVSEPKEGLSDFHELLLEQDGVSPVADRERNLGRGIVFRLEHAERRGEFVAGEICRKQTSNIPPQVGDDGLAPIELADGQGIGHVAAFKFHYPTRILLLQQNRQCGTASRLCSYIKELQSKSTFSIDPVYREDAWERARGKPIRNFRVRFAAPRDLSSFDDDGASGARGAKKIAGIFDAPEIEIALGVGRRRKQTLNQPSVWKFLRWLRSSEAEVTKMEATILDDGQAELVDFVDEHLSFGQELDLPDRNPKENYHRRKRFLDDIFDDNMNYLKEKFGV